MTPVILVARREDGGWRDDLWKFCRNRWETLLPDFSISEGFHRGPEPFSFSAAINASARTATECEPDWDVCLYIGADWLAQTAAQCVEAAECALACGQLVFAHDQTALLTEWQTTALLNGEIELADALEDAEWHRHTFSGVVAVPRVLWEAVGGFDERYRFWGLEDMAFMDACNALGGTHRVPGSLVHMWHPQVWEEREGNPEHAANLELWGRYRAVKNDAIGMRALLSEPGGPLFDTAQITRA